MPSILMLVLSLHARDAYAGDDPCKRAKLEEDKFGGGTNMVYVVQAMGAVRMELKVASGATEMNVALVQTGDIEGVLASGTTVPFSFDGTVLTLTTAREGPARARPTGRRRWPMLLRSHPSRSS